RMIHLRSELPALADGQLVPLQASVAGVAAYARRAGDQVVIIVANLTNAPLRGLSISSERGALPRGNWKVESLLDRGRVSSLRIAEDGRLVGYTPIPELAPLEGYVLRLTR